jgi:putative molybdopterin biosynthesis protein
MYKELLTVKEAAKYLSINEKKLYAMANAHKIPCTRVTGKWLFPKQLLEEWIICSARENLMINKPANSLQKNIILHGSHDLLLEILACKLKKHYPDYSLSISHIGSMGGLVALKSGICHITGIHLLDPDTGRQNSDYVKEILSDMEVVCVRLAKRQQGLIIAAGNPHGIKGISDLARLKITYINRQPGSGTRIMFDHELKQLHIPATKIKGYENEAFTHMEVAMEIFNGHADAGLGIYSAAHTFQLGFLPVAEENYDLVIPKEIFLNREIQALLKTIRSADFKARARQLGGYNLEESGEVVDSNNAELISGR